MSFIRNRLSQSMDKIKHENSHKTFTYSKLHQTMNLYDMYESLNPSIQQLIQQNRKKLISMSPNKSKDLVNKTHSKLLSYLKARPVRKTYCSPKSNTQRSNDKIFNIYRRQQETKQNRSQEIFDFNKLQKIMQTQYQRSSIQKSKQSSRFSGALAQKVIKLAKNSKRQLSTARPLTNRTQSAINLQLSATNGAYMGWKAQKIKRKTRKLFI